MSNAARMEAAAKLALVPRLDALQAIAGEVARKGRCDAQLAPIWAEKLRFTYKKTLETKYPEYTAANGDVLPIDTSVDPADLEWEYFTIDQQGWADWIDDDGDFMPSGTLTATRKTGRMENMGHEWSVTIFDLEKAAKANLQLSTLKSKNAKRTHDAKTNWTWLFGDSGKGLPGLCNHPNISVSLAAQNAGATSRLWENKTNAEIVADINLLIDTVPQQTIEQHHVAKVLMPAKLIRLCRNRRLATTDGSMTSLWSYIKDLYSGDDSGQGKVTFKQLNECDGARRLHPKSNTDTSGLSGDFLLALPAENMDELAFIRARPFTQRPPEEHRLKMLHLTHSKIGGCKVQYPLSVHRLDFGTT